MQQRSGRTSGACKLNQSSSDSNDSVLGYWLFHYQPVPAASLLGSPCLWTEMDLAEPMKLTTAMVTCLC